MTRPPNIHAIATRDSIANLWLLAERDGEVTIRTSSERACINIRNRLYKHRESLRKQNAALQGVHASHLDNFKFTFKAETEGEHRVMTGKWLLTITYDEIVEFELLLPENYQGELPSFDVPEDNTKWDESVQAWVEAIPQPSDSGLT